MDFDCPRERVVDFDYLGERVVPFNCARERVVVFDHAGEIFVGFRVGRRDRGRWLSTLQERG